MFFVPKLAFTHWFIAAIMCSCGLSEAFIEFVAITTQEGSVSVFLGELRLTTYTSTDPWAASEDCDKAALLTLLRAISQGTKPTTVILELKPEDKPQFRFLPADSDEHKVGCLSALGGFSALHDNHLGSLKYVWADKRGPVASELCKILGCFSRSRLQQALHKHHEHIAALYPAARKTLWKDQGIFNTVRSQCLRRIYGFTVQQCLAEMDDAIALVCRLQAAHKHNPVVQQMLVSYATRLSELKQHALSFFGGTESLTKPCVVKVFDSAREHSFTHVRGQIHTWLLPFDRLVKDIYFFDCMATALAQRHNSIFFGDTSHALALHGLATQLGMETICSYDSRTKEDGPGSSSTSLASSFATASLQSIMQTIISTCLQHAPKAIRSEPATMRECGYCKKQRADLKRCGLCGQVFYCSLDCQQKDWGTHKPACIKKGCSTKISS